MQIRFIFFLVLIVFVSLSSCERDEATTDPSAKLSFSTDTLGFDTVFTNIGTATKRILIYNKNSKPLIISSLTLAGDSFSAFKINVDGMIGPKVNDIQIEANDSAYIFVQVIIDPTNSNSPLIVEDSLLFAYNGNQQSINLRAWGQDIHLLKDSALKTQTWINDKPYVIYEAALVDSLETLTIEAGTTIYLHRNAWFGANGTLIINGTKEQPVVFRGDRLDKANYSPQIPYDKIPGQWSFLYLSNSSSNNKFNYTNIRNAQIGLIVGTVNKPGKASVELNNCRFENHSAAALYGNGSKIKAVNCIFSNAGSAVFVTSTGGEYEFYHCTFANYLAIGEKNGLGIFLQNYVEIENDSTGKKDKFYGDLTKAYFGNCIIYGDLTDQLGFRSTNDYKFDYTFDHCLIRGNTDKLDLANTAHFIKPKVSKEEKPGFVKIDQTNFIYNFELEYKSLARDIGNSTIGKLYPFDFNGNPRDADDAPDAGAFEYIPDPLEK